MDPETHGKPKHFRGKPRPGREVSVQYCMAATEGDEVTPIGSAVTRNLGTGGAFILCREPMPVGTRLQLFLRLPTVDHDIGVAAEVRWVVTVGEDPEDAGMGVKFLQPGVDVLLALSEYFASLTGMDPVP